MSIWETLLLSETVRLNKENAELHASMERLLKIDYGKIYLALENERLIEANRRLDEENRKLQRELDGARKLVQQSNTNNR